MSDNPDADAKECGAHCRRMADSNYRLAQQAYDPEMIASHLDLAFEYLRCAETADRMVALRETNVVTFPPRRRAGAESR